MAAGPGRGGADASGTVGRVSPARSGPVFRRIAEATLRHLGVGPTLNAPAPVIVARREVPIDDVGPQPVSAPLPSTQPPAVTPGEMPDLLGLSARDALRTLMQVGLTPRLDGDGFVIDQSPRAGALLTRGDTCVLKLGRRPRTAAGGTAQ